MIHILFIAFCLLPILNIQIRAAQYSGAELVFVQVQNLYFTPVSDSFHIPDSGSVPVSAHPNCSPKPKQRMFLAFSIHPRLSSQVQSQIRKL
jgi:nitrate reductase NapE component